MSNITRLIIAGVEVPISADLPISTTYALADVREPDKRNSSYTKTIQVYGCGAVNTLFENIFEVNVNTLVYNANKKLEAAYYLNDVKQIGGNIRITRIVKQPNNNIVYELAILGTEASLFVDIGDKFMEQIDFSDLNHYYNKTNQKNSWDTSYILSGSPVSFNLGSGYVYPMIHYGYQSSNYQYSVEYFKPAIYLREWLVRIFGNAGYRWSSSFLDSVLFKHFIIPSNVNKISIPDSAVLNAAIYAGFVGSGYSSNQSFILPAGSPAAVPSFTFGFFHKPDTSSLGAGYYLVDNNGQYNTSTGIITVLSTGVYNIEANVSLSEKIVVASSTYALTSGSDNYYVYIEASTDGGSTWFVIGGKIDHASGVYQLHNTTKIVSVNCQTGNYNLAAGTKVRVRCSWEIDIASTTRGGATTVLTYHFSQASYDGGDPSSGTYRSSTENYIALNRTDPSVGDNDLLLMNNALPKNIKQRDLVKSVFQKFNLYCEPDKLDPKTLYIEPRDAFYLNGSPIDWTKNHDKSKDVEILPMSELTFKNFILKDKADKDYYNDLYDKEFVDNYGLERFSVDNDFVKGDNVTETIFSPTPLTGFPDTQIICPKICAYDGVNVKPIDHNIRLLYYGGLKPGYWEYNSVVSGQTIEHNYPYCGHLDSPQNPTYDLNFSYAKRMFYNYLGAALPSSNGFRNYYEKFINEITDRDSKMLRAFFFLNSLDINAFTFRKKIFWDGQTFIVNRIIDVDPTTERSIQVELIKTVEYALPPRPPINFPFPSIPDSPIYARQINPNNAGYGTGMSVRGVGNMATGSNIFIDDTSSNVQLINCTNVSAFGLRNFTGNGLSNMILDPSYSGKTIFGGDVSNQKPQYANILLLR